MDQDTSFRRLLGDLHEGDSAAAEQVFHAYFVRLVGFAKKKIASRYHAKVDPEGIAASVMRTFFRRHQEHPFANLSDADDLWRLLAHIAFCKCCNRVKRFRAPGSAEDRETPIPEDASIADSVVAEGDMVVADLIAQATLGFSGIEKQIVEMTLNQMEVKDTAQEFNISERTVLRVRKRFRIRLEKLLQTS